MTSARDAARAMLSVLVGTTISAFVGIAISIGLTLVGIAISIGLTLVSLLTGIPIFYYFGSLGEVGSILAFASIPLFFNVLAGRKFIQGKDMVAGYATIGVGTILSLIGASMVPALFQLIVVDG